ncbi:MAG TPA: T9SS type A sorting domain-containing protein, partial [Flavipsychrobacter sp.]|nr:T9SS type A sorting domain-containing protein [Flavipsychrobacter sp.]
PKIMAKTLLLIIFFMSSLYAKGQIFEQHFDGADTLISNSVFIVLDTSSSNVWQIGPPQKTIFDSAFSAPNVLITDTVNYYPINANSSFNVYHPYMDYSWGIFAFRWMQKLDLDTNYDGAIIEFSTDNGNSWQNVFNSPNVYNFYGYDTANVDSLVTGEYAFSGTDSSWRDIWLCFDYSFWYSFDSVKLRFRFVSDSIDNQKEGWMIDNFRMHRTWIHTAAKSVEQLTTMKVYPTNTSGIVYIEGPKLQEYHIIRNMQVISADGKVVKEYGLSPVKFHINIGDLPDGIYYLKVNTNKKSETFPLLLKR